MAYDQLYIETEQTFRVRNGSQTERKKKIGVVQVKRDQREWLNISAEYDLNRAEKIKRKEHTRTIKDINGRIVKENIRVQESETSQGFPNSPIGAKTIQVLTNIKTNGGSTKKIRFSFPTWATLLQVADFLGTVIPENKIGDGLNEVQPIFLSPSGKSPRFASKSAAANESKGVKTAPEAPIMVETQIETAKKN